MGVRIFGWYPSGNGILPYTELPTQTIDVGVVKFSSNNTAAGTTITGPGALMCALYVVSGTGANMTWVPCRWDWFK